MKVRPKEYFAESEYGVKASPRVSMLSSNLPRGGGRDQLGKPYQVRGKWYYPKEEKGYRKVGIASWYGDAFHGRLTANGEIYDKTHLTAAHPTMPLPSYARVTNTLNGASVIVRVNDRGPYADGRVIDLSERAAEMLDYTHGGTAKVKVEYVGRAPLDGHDDRYLMASYHPGNKLPDPSDGLPTGVMIAMNGAAPSTPKAAKAMPFPGQLVDSSGTSSSVVAQANDAAGAYPILPEIGPIVPERPEDTASLLVASAANFYVDEPVSNGSAAVSALASAMSPADVVASWNRQQHSGRGKSAYIVVGTYDTAAAARSVADKLAGTGRMNVAKTLREGVRCYVVNAYPLEARSVDSTLQAAWANGATDAVVVRD